MRVTALIKLQFVFLAVSTTGLHFAHSDQLLIVTTGAVRDETEARLRTFTCGGKLARWKGELGA